MSEITTKAEVSKSLVLDRVSAGYGTIQALHEITLNVDSGEWVAVIGANGAGKTTFLNLAAGLIKPWNGSITLGSINITDHSASHRSQLGIGLVPEGRRVFPRMTVRENLLVGAHNRTDQIEIFQDLAAINELFPILLERSNQFAGTLSGGEQQMLAIGRAMMGRPKLLLLDEPSMGVAPILVKGIFEALARLHAKGLTVVVVEQNAKLALKSASRGYVIEGGRIVLEGASDKLLSDPNIKRAYLG
jgi:branched-chain amino acid transport system ATP-binding protein